MMPDTAVAVVTDSTATLSADLLAEHSIEVVPLQVVIGDTSYDEDTGAPPRVVAAALKQHRAVSTSRPGPEVFVDVYERLAGQGHEAIVSVHLSREVSGTWESAQLAARRVEVPVRVVDTRLVGIGTGLAAVAAARAARRGADVVAAATAASEQAAATTTLIYVNTLEHLRRGGRVGNAAALMGSALAVKLLLIIDEGRIVPLEKVRTSGRALARLESRAVDAAVELGDRPVAVVVQHLAASARADALAADMRERLTDRGVDAEVTVGEVGAVIGAHVGPGMVAVVVAPN
jgi:DegV family protein with EDD domain